MDPAIPNSGGLRADLLFAPPTAGEQPGEGRRHADRPAPVVEGRIVKH